MVVYRGYVCVLLVPLVCNAFVVTPSVALDLRPTRQNRRKLPTHNPPGIKDAVVMPSSTAVFANDPAEAGSSEGATIPQEIFNLVKGIVGAGVLSLPSGIAAFGNAKSAVIPATILVSFFGGLSGYAFALIGRVCHLTGTTSYQEAWSDSVSESTSWIPAASVTFVTLSAVLAYSMILGETFAKLAVTAGIKGVTKTNALLAVTTTTLLPLCLLKNLSSLAPFSLLGSLGMIYTTIAMGIRYFGKAYSAGGKFLGDIPANLQPSFGNVGAAGVLTTQASILIGMLSTAYLAHFNAPKFYVELRDNTIPRFTKVVTTSFGISTALFAFVSALGFLTFGSACSGLILNNYSTRDTLMSLSRIAVAISLVFSYPLAFVGAREGILDLFKAKNVGAGKQNVLTLGMLSAVTVGAIVVPDVSFVLAFSGATLGNSLIYVFPALMFRGAVKKMESASNRLKREVKFALGSAALGIVMGFLGAKTAIQSL